MSNSSLKRKLDTSNESDSVPNRSQVLNEKLSRRPDRHQLVEQRILFDSHCAPSLQYAEHALKRARLADELNNRLSNRPGPLDLIQHKILHINTSEHPNLEEAIQDGQIPFKTTSSPPRRPLIFHEYTGSPSLCKPKVTKVDSLSSSNTHQIRLAQQQLLLELTAANKAESEQQVLLPRKSLEQMTLVELKDLCKQYHIPSSHANKTKLIERIKQAQIKQDVSTSTSHTIELSNADIIASLQILDTNDDDEVQLLSTSELDEILQTLPGNLITRDDPSLNVTHDFDIQNFLIDPQIINSDDLFVEMLLNSDYSSSPITAFDESVFSDLLPISSPVPRITSVDEFDAFLRDFTLYSSSSSRQQEVLTPIS